MIAMEIIDVLVRKCAKKEIALNHIHEIVCGTKQGSTLLLLGIHQVRTNNIGADGSIDETKTAFLLGYDVNNRHPVFLHSREEIDSLVIYGAGLSTYGDIVCFKMNDNIIKGSVLSADYVLGIYNIKVPNGNGGFYRVSIPSSAILNNRVINDEAEDAKKGFLKELNETIEAIENKIKECLKDGKAKRDRATTRR